MGADSTIAAHYEAAQARWPAIALDRATFEAFVAARSSAAGETLSHHELFLVCACLRGDPSAIGVFESQYIATVPRHLARATRDRAVIEEVQQRVRERALLGGPRSPSALESFSGRGSLEAWVRVVATRIHLDLLRQRDDRATATSADLAAPSELSPELLALRQRCLPALADALADALRALSARDRALFRLHFVDGVTLDRIAALYGVNKSTVSRWISAARDSALSRASDQVRAALGVGPDSAASLFALVQSQLEVSLSSLLSA